MLDQLSDTDAALGSKLSAKPVNVTSTARHPSQEDLESYANGRLTAARLDFCRAHLDSCEACRAELEDIRTLQTTLSAFPRADAKRRESKHRGRRGSLALPLTVAAAAIVTVTASITFWWRHERLTTHQVSAAPSVARPDTPPTPPATPSTRVTSADVSPNANAGANAQSRETRPAAAVAAPPTASVLPAASAPQRANTAFSLLAPLGETTPEPRPQFKWQPLAGAIGYKVVIVDTGLHPIQHSPPIRATTWRPRRPLPRGRTYLWQVTATLHGGSQVVASTPTSSAAVLRIVPVK